MPSIHNHYFDLVYAAFKYNSEFYTVAKLAGCVGV